MSESPIEGERKVVYPIKADVYVLEKELKFTVKSYKKNIPKRTRV